MFTWLKRIGYIKDKDVSRPFKKTFWQKVLPHQSFPDTFLGERILVGIVALLDGIALCLLAPWGFSVTWQFDATKWLARQRMKRAKNTIEIK